MLLNIYIQFTSLFDNQRTLCNPAFNAWYDHEIDGIASLINDLVGSQCIIAVVMPAKSIKIRK